MEENFRVDCFANVFEASLERIGDVDGRNGEVVIVENCRTRTGCRTLIVDLGMTIIRLRSRVREHSVDTMLVVELLFLSSR